MKFQEISRDYGLYSWGCGCIFTIKSESTMLLNATQVKRITDTIKELIESGIDTLVEIYFPVETEQPKTNRNRKRRAKKKARTNTKKV
jgi:hypothetical protein